MADYMKPVVFGLGNQKFGVDINLVQSIEDRIKIVPVPNTVKYVSGIVNMRGDVIPVFSLKKKFEMDEDSLNKGENMIIVSLPDMKLALEVDSVLEIGDIDKDKIVEMPLIAKVQGTEYLDRVAEVDGDLIILLDVTKILTEEEADGVKKFAEEMNKDN